MKKAKAEDKQKRAAAAEAAKDKLAEMEVNESFAQMEEDQQHICRLSDMEAMTDGENNDGPEDEIASNDYEESSDKGLAESESLAAAAAMAGGDESDESDETEQSRKPAPKVSFGLNSIQVQILTVTSRESRRLCRS